MVVVCASVRWKGKKDGELEGCKDVYKNEWLFTMFEESGASRGGWDSGTDDEGPA